MACAARRFHSEARICAVANVYVKLMTPSSGAEGWSHEQAVRQMRSMGGVQLDPDISERIVSLKQEDVFLHPRRVRSCEAVEA